jgi:hypothetical protein
LDFLACSSDTNDDTLSPTLVTRFQRSSHDADVTSTVKGVVASTVRHVDEVFLDGFLEFGRVHKVGCTEFLGPFFFAIVGIDCNDFRGTVGDAALDYAETDASGTEDGASGAFLDFGGSGSSTESGCDTASEKTSLLERSLGVNGNNRDVGDDCWLGLHGIGHTGVLRESGGAHVVENILAASTETSSSIGHLSLALSGTDLSTQVGLAALLVSIDA